LNFEAEAKKFKQRPKPTVTRPRRRPWFWTVEANLASSP